jgi:hypothetical protein
VLNFSKASILNNPQNASCEEIFNAFCYELGQYYKPLGGRFAKSGPHITFKRKNVKLKLCFWSSSSNQKGEYVSLEIIPNFYSAFVSDKAGYFFGYPVIYKTLEDKAKNNFNIFGATGALFSEIVNLINSYVLSALDAFESQEETKKYLSTLDPVYLNSFVEKSVSFNQFLKAQEKC